jgi:hypothetical protein
MPEISRFFGIVITMFYNDHSPPHFHARYGGQKAVISIEDGSLVAGRLSPRALGLVQDWVRTHRSELEENWALARSTMELRKIEPLE